MKRSKTASDTLQILKTNALSVDTTKVELAKTISMPVAEPVKSKSIENGCNKCNANVNSFSKSKTNNNLTTLSNGEVRLVSPYGDACGYIGGGGSGGCVITGPYG